MEGGKLLYIITFKQQKSKFFAQSSPETHTIYYIKAKYFSKHFDIDNVSNSE